MEKLTIETERRESLVNVTHLVQALVTRKGWQNGAVLLWSPHTTAGITVNEAADPDVIRDITRHMHSMVPQRSDFEHAEGNSDAHIKTSLFGPGQTLIVANGKMQLGTWQGIFFCDWDGPRRRSLWVQWLPGE